MMKPYLWYVDVNAVSDKMLLCMQLGHNKMCKINMPSIDKMYAV